MRLQQCLNNGLSNSASFRFFTPPGGSRRGVQAIFKFETMMSRTIEEPVSALCPKVRPRRLFIRMSLELNLRNAHPFRSSCFITMQMALRQC